MIELLKNTIEVRGVPYTVTELTAKHMVQVRKFVAASENWKAEAYIAQACCIDPKISAVEADLLPQHVIDAISTEAFRLTKSEGEDAKNA